VYGPVRDKLTIDAANHSRAFLHNGYYTYTMTINDLTIVNGVYNNPYAYSNGGGCIYSASYLELNRVTVSSCYTSALYTAATGGAIFARYGATISDSVITGSTAKDRGGHGGKGGGIDAGKVDLTRSTISGNSVFST